MYEESFMEILRKEKERLGRVLTVKEFLKLKVAFQEGTLDKTNLCSKSSK